MRKDARRLRAAAEWLFLRQIRAAGTSQISLVPTGNGHRNMRRQLSGKSGEMAGAKGLEPSASAVTGQRSNQLSYAPAGDARALKCGPCQVKIPRQIARGWRETPILP